MASSRQETHRPDEGADEPAIHVAGNSVLDLLVRGIPSEAGPAADVWNRANVAFLEEPVEGVLGGNGAAVAYLLGRLGDQVSLNTQVGVDPLGQVVRGWLRESRVSIVVPPAETTAVNLVMLTPGGERRSICYTGQKVAWRDSLEVRGAGWFYASGYGQATSEDLAELACVFEAFRARGSRVAFDPGPWFARAASREEMLGAWQWVDCLIGTEDELVIGQAGVEPRGLIERLLETGPEQVVMKRGPKGAAFGSRWEGTGILLTEGVVAANTVGAGDTFNASLLHGLISGEDLESAVRTAIRLATEAVKRGRGVMGALGWDGDSRSGNVEPKTR